MNEADRSARVQQLAKDAQVGGYHLNGDTELVNDLADGLIANESRYGYPSCPCRRASGDRQRDLDIICPCDYRDADLTEFGACY